MQATLDAFALKSLHRALTCLTKYGEDLTIDANPDSLSLFTTNSSKSAYCRFRYQKDFFSKYVVRHGRDGDPGDEEPCAQGQLLTKSLLSILKHRTVEKTVDKCELSIIEGSAEPDAQDEEADSLESRLIVRLHCKHGVVKTHRLLLQTPMSLLSPVLPPDHIPESRLIVSARAAKDMLEPFSGGGGDPQLVWSFGEDEVTVRSWDGGAGKGAGDPGRIIQMATELRVSVEDFDGYEICEGADGIGFQLKEFNATVGYADGLSLPLSLRFADCPGAPLFIEVEGEDAHGLFVISTSDQSRQSHSQGKTARGATKKRARGIDKEDAASDGRASSKAVKGPMRVVQRTDPDRAYSRARSTLTSSGPMPPSAGGASSSSRQDAAVKDEQEALFLPSQTDDPGGLGLQGMSAEELAEMLDGDGEDVIGSNTRLSPDWDMAGMDDDDRGARQSPERQKDVWDDSEFGATQADGTGSRGFHPLFED